MATNEKLEIGHFVIIKEMPDDWGRPYYCSHLYGAIIGQGVQDYTSIVLILGYVDNQKLRDNPLILAQVKENYATFNHTSVEIENKYLKKHPSFYGCKYVKCNNTEKEVQTMNQIRSNEPFQVVRVQFLQGTNTYRQYSYASYGEIAVGDTVVVKSAHNGFGIAKVVGIVENPNEADIAFVCEGREIVDKFTMEYYNNRVEFRKQVIADEKRKAELKKQMQKLAMEDNELIMFAKMAELNPKMKALLDEFNSIGTRNMADENENKV